MDYLTLYILAVIFLATVVRSTLGFGESLIAVPLLIYFIPAEVAVPLSVLVSIVVAGVVVVQDRKRIHFYSAKWLIIFAALGIPLGLAMLKYGNENYIKLTLGALLILYSLYSLMDRRKFLLATDSKAWLFVCGFLSGIFGGAYGLNGPPLVVYGHMRKWTAQYFRATLQAYFLPASLMGMIGYWHNGLLTSAVTGHFLFCLPVIIPAIFLGRFLNRRLDNQVFLKYVYVGLIGIGVALALEGAISLGEK